MSQTNYIKHSRSLISEKSYNEFKTYLLQNFRIKTPVVSARITNLYIINIPNP